MDVIGIDIGIGPPGMDPIDMGPKGSLCIMGMPGEPIGIGIGPDMDMMGPDDMGGPPCMDTPGPGPGPVIPFMEESFLELLIL